MKKQSNKSAIIILIAAMAFLVFWFGYSTAMKVLRSDQSVGFRLPPGDVEAGKVTFRDLRCMDCHSVKGSKDFPMPDRPQEWHVVLGGEIHVVKTYGELVTAVIHPSESIRPEVHKILMNADGNSIMPDLTAQMTTRQMIDLVTYLQNQYTVVMPQYPMNYYPYELEYGP
ncbi:cytochrome c [Puniceicoccales bacterium CK1056]|uniref:Cytochrome c n=1 Tax=Oceanipulchritudo coccoides TaxID=2706888 RepID=A0A6B2M7L1_9BACT|nr:c-type cytochrome [Oceanipulchritudo coccoides]NDV63590.1 cytochrome c [Oceanipulchritudo coccoides]